eukprot:s3043_g5.t1
MTFGGSGVRYWAVILQSGDCFKILYDVPEPGLRLLHPCQIGPIPPANSHWLKHKIPTVLTLTGLMEIELLRARAKMAQDQLLRLEQHHGKWCDGELCDELLKLRGAVAPSSALGSSSSLGSATPRPASQQNLASQDRWKPGRWDLSLVPEHGSFEAAPDLFRGTFAVRPTLQPRVPLDEELVMPKRPISSKTSPKAHGSWEMEYTMGHDTPDGFSEGSRASSMSSMRERESGTSFWLGIWDEGRSHVSGAL